MEVKLAHAENAL